MHVKVYSDENTMVCDTQMHPENPGLSTGTFSIELSPEYTRNSKNLKGIFIINRNTKQRQDIVFCDVQFTIGIGFYIPRRRKQYCFLRRGM